MSEHSLSRTTLRERTNPLVLWQISQWALGEADYQLRHHGRHVGKLWLFGGTGRKSWCVPPPICPPPAAIGAEGLEGLDLLRAGVRWMAVHLEADGVAWMPADAAVPTLDRRHQYVQLERLGEHPRVYVRELGEPWIEVEGSVGETLLALPAAAAS